MRPASRVPGRGSRPAHEPPWRVAAIAQTFRDILDALPRFRDLSEASREILLANLVMLGEVPAPTFKEERRIELLLQRFSECGLQNASTDEAGNALGILPGLEGEQNILVVANADTLFPEEADHTIAVQTERLIGTGIGNNSLGVAVLASLPTLLEQMDIHLKSNLILMGAARSLGRGNQEGLRFFLANNTRPLRAGVCVTGAGLGAVSFTSVGMARGDITCNVPEEHDWSRFDAVSAIITINEIINRILEIRLPRRPLTSVVLGQIEGGDSYETLPTHAALRFEIRSKSADQVRAIRRQIGDIVAEFDARPGGDVSLDVFARRKPGGIRFTHPLTRHARRILKRLALEPAQGPSRSELSEFIDRKIPAITVGISSGERPGKTSKKKETLQIKPMFTGMAQLLGILLAIDGGFCDED